MCKNKLNKLNKITVLILVTILLVTTLTSCKKDINKDIPLVNNNENILTEIKAFSKEMNKTITSTDDIEELKEYFKSAKDKIGEQTYLSNFDMDNTVLAMSYVKEYSVENYTEKETIITHSDSGSTDVYIAYEIVSYYEPEYSDSDEGEGYVEYIITGLNRYTFSNNKLVKFKKVL